MADRRIPLLHRYPDPQESSDPAIRELVAQLATLDVAPRPRPEFRSELRAQLVAITPRIVEEARTATETKAERATKTATKTAAEPAKARRRHSLGRPLVIAASTVVVLALILGGAVWMSRKALPGDTLYGLKRVSEDFQYSLADNDTERAKDLLDFASTRADEANALAGRASASGVGPQAAGMSAGTAKLITSTLGSADSDVRTATRLLTNQAVRTGSTQALTTLITWSPEQSARFTTLAAKVPAGSLRNRVAASAQVLHAAVARAEAIRSDVAHHRATLTPDPLGPVPCTANCATTRRTGPGSGSTGGGGSVTGGTTGNGGTGATTGTTGRTGTSGVTPPGVVPSTTAPGLPSLPIKLPTSSLPIKLPSLPNVLPHSAPVKVNPSCVSASVVLGITIGQCSNS